MTTSLKSRTALAALVALAFTGCALTPQEHAELWKKANRPCQPESLTFAANVYCKSDGGVWPPVELQMPGRF